MKESVSYTYLLNMMIIFIGISFCVLLAIFSYSKAFRVNSKIALALEVSEGYNELSKNEIESIIKAYGYNEVNGQCKPKNGVEAITGTNGYCLYEIKETVFAGQPNEAQYIYYGITTYISFDFSVFNSFLKLPVYNTTEKIYVFK